jgi:hypothetical protein
LLHGLTIRDQEVRAVNDFLVFWATYIIVFIAGVGMLAAN